MITKKLLWPAFFAMIAIQWYLPASLIVQQENTLAKGTIWKFRTEPVDPNDVFRGKYINLNFENSEVHFVGDFELKENTEVYVRLMNDPEGFAYPSEMFMEYPGDGDDIMRAFTSFQPSFDINGEEDSHERIRLQFPFNRFYMDETKASAAETSYLEAVRDSLSETWAIVAVHNGESVLKDVVIDGKSVKEISNE